MLDSTARAERVDIIASEAASYTWEVAQKPVAVRFPLPLIDRLESEAVEAFRSLTSRGSEIGGLLLGFHAPGNPSLVTVSDFELISCDYGRGPLYRLSDSDLARFEQAMGKHAAGSVMGFFRSHTRKGLSLDAEDLAFFEPRFLEPQQIVLLIRPFATKVSMAGIFVRESGRIVGESSYREFPFRSSELTHAGGSAMKPESATASAPAAQAATQPVAPPKPPSRAQIVPIASRREITLPEPVVISPNPPPAVTDRVETPAPPAPKAPAAPAVEKPAPTVEKDEKEKGKEKEKEKSAAASALVTPAPPAPVALVVEEKTKTEELPSVPAEEITLSTPAPKNKKLRLVVAAAIGMLILGGGGLIIYPSLVKRSSPSHPTAPQDSSPLSLRVERTSGGMLLTWNRDLPVIQSASKVVLSITDGDRHENIQLDPNQVRTGSILYPPITGDVSFQMEVTDPHQSKTTSESLRVLDPRPSPLDAPASGTTAPAGAKDAAGKPATNTAAADSTPASATTPTAEDPKAPEETPASHPAANLKPFNSASLAQRLRAVSPTDLPDEAPPVVKASPAVSGSLAGIVSTQTAVPAPPKPVPQAPVPAPKVGGQLIAARVITRVDPEYPRLARQAGAGGIVELEATISVDGKVKNPRVIRGNSMLQKAAIDAVLQWRYQPAMLNGKPVESPVEIKLNFVTQGH